MRRTPKRSLTDAGLQQAPGPHTLLHHPIPISSPKAFDVGQKEQGLKLNTKQQHGGHNLRDRVPRQRPNHQQLQPPQGHRAPGVYRHGALGVQGPAPRSQGRTSSWWQALGQYLPSLPRPLLMLRSVGNGTPSPTGMAKHTQRDKPAAQRSPAHPHREHRTPRSLQVQDPQQTMAGNSPAHSPTPK